MAPLNCVLSTAGWCDPSGVRGRRRLTRPRPRDSPAWISEWTHPKTGAEYTIQLSQSHSLSSDDFRACLSLIEETSSEDYKASAGGWHPRQKTREMKSEELRYILVKGGSGGLGAFVSLMPCYEEGEPVVYCYEIHLKPQLRR